MTISDEAIEAAAKAGYQFIRGRMWGTVDQTEADMYRGAARRALEAAAQHMTRGCRLNGS